MKEFRWESYADYKTPVLLWIIAGVAMIILFVIGAVTV